MEPFLAQIMMFGGNFAPRGWAFCENQLLPINSNQALFSLLGTTYGGDGRTTFSLPDLRGRVPMHSGSGPGLSTHRLGAKGGVENVILNQLQIPSHTHSGSLSNVTGALEAGNGKAGTFSSGSYLATSNGFTNSGGGGNISGVGVSGSVTIGNTGGNLSHTNMQPYQVVSFCIALQGIFPSRS